MSLRTLKFKPKLLLNSAAKNKSNESNSLTKDVSIGEKPINNIDNSSLKNTVEELKKEGPLINNFTAAGINNSKEKSTPENISVQNFEATVAPKLSNLTTTNSKGPDAPTNLSTSCKIPVPDTINIAVKQGDTNISNISQRKFDVPPKRNAGGESCCEIKIVAIEDGLKSSPSKTDKRLNGPLSCSLKSSPSKTDKRLDGPLSCSEHDFNNEDFQESIKKSKNQLINYDVLNKISHEQNSSKTESIASSVPKIHNENSLPKTDNCNIDGKKALEEVKENVKKVTEKKAVRFKDHVSSRSSLHHNKSCTEKLSDSLPEQKVRKKRGESKSVNVSSKKLASHPKSNFKPNLAALGKLRRPDKFSSFSYSQMEFLAMEQFYEKFGNTKEPDSSKLTMKDLIFYNPSSNPMSQSSDKKLLTSLNNSTKTEKVEGDLSEDSEKTDECKKEEKTDDDILPVPQLKISADGKVIVAQESLVVKPSQNSENLLMETVIDEECRNRKAVKNPNRCGWSHDDTIKFYKALNSLGCDFETMMTIFPDRSRKNLKSKFKREEKLHGSLINKVLSRHSEFDVASVVQELEIDSVYQSTIKNYGRDLVENKKRSRGRKKPFSSVVAGSSPGKYDEDSDDEIDETFTKNKRKLDPNLMLKITNVLNLSEKNSPTLTENNNESSKSGIEVENLKEGELPKRKRKKLIENLESDDCIIEDEIKDIIDEKSKVQQLPKNSRLNKRKTKLPIKKNLPTKNIVIRLEDLIDFNEGMNQEEPKKNKEEVNENHIIINTNIEFENVKYTRYISYDSNNLENPLEINETVAHVD